MEREEKRKKKRESLITPSTFPFFLFASKYTWWTLVVYVYNIKLFCAHHVLHIKMDKVQCTLQMDQAIFIFFQNQCIIIFLWKYIVWHRILSIISFYFGFVPDVWEKKEVNNPCINQLGWPDFFFLSNLLPKLLCVKLNCSSLCVCNAWIFI